MTRLPVLSGRKLVSLLRRFGYEVDRQTGSHIVLRNTAPPGSGHEEGADHALGLIALLLY